MNLQKLGVTKKISKLIVNITWCSVSPSKNLTLAIAFKNYAKADIKIFSFSPVLLGFTFCQIFCPGL